MNDVKYIGLCFSRHFKFYSHEVVEGMVQVAAEHPWLHFVDLRFFMIDQIYDRLAGARVDALILGLNVDEYAFCKKEIPCGIPIINVHPDLLASHIPTVCIDYDALAKNTAEYLGSLGYRSLACLGARGTQTSTELADCLEPVAMKLNFKFESYQVNLEPEFYETDMMKPEDEFVEWVVGLPHETAVVTTGGYTALLLEQTALSLGRAVPGDLAVLSISDDEICLFAEPPISCLRSAGAEIGRIALGVIKDTLRGSEHPSGRILLPPPAIIERRSTGFPTGMDEGAKRALRFIREHACEGISVDDVVRHIRIMGRTRLYNQLKRYIGRSPAAEIMRLRIERAKHLLATTNLPVTRVVEDCGFNSHAQFSVSFRRETGMTPMEYRKNLSAAYIELG